MYYDERVREPTFEEAAALVSFANRHGTGWKKHLLWLWSVRRQHLLLREPEGAMLQELREGPGRIYMRFALERGGMLLKYLGFHVYYKPDASHPEELNPYRGYQLVTKTPRSLAELEAKTIFQLRDKIDQFHRRW